MRKKFTITDTDRICSWCKKKITKGNSVRKDGKMFHKGCVKKYTNFFKH